MAMRVNHNVPALNALRNLNNTDDDMKNTLERLSSGLKVNRGADGPAVLVISEQMRGQISSIDQALKNSEASVSMVQTAEASLTEVNRLLISLRQLAIHAANEGANDDKMLAADQAEVENALDTIDRIARNSQFGTRTLFDGSNGANGTAVGDGLDFITAEAFTKPSPADGYPINITSAATKAEKRGTRSLMLEDVSSDTGAAPFKITLSEGGRNVTFSTDNPKENKVISNMVASFRRGGTMGQNQLEENVQQYVAQRLQQLADDGGLALEVSLEWDANQVGNILVVRHKEYGSNPEFSVSSNTAGLLTEKAGTIEPAIPGRDVEGTIDGHIGVGDGEYLLAPPNINADGLRVRFNSQSEMRTRVPRFVTDEQGQTIPNPQLKKIDQLPPPVPGARLLSKEDEKQDVILNWKIPTDISGDEEGFVHVTQNSLAFQVGPTRGHQVKVSLQDMKSQELSQGIQNKSKFGSLRDIDVTNAQGAQDAMLLIDDAISVVSSMRAELGAFQKNTLESNSNSMRIAHENLTAAESSLRDADMAEEMSRFTRNQIMMASGVAMLAQANQTPQSVLQLLNARPQ